MTIKIDMTDESAKGKERQQIKAGRIPATSNRSTRTGAINMKRNPTARIATISISRARAGTATRSRVIRTRWTRD